MTTIFEKYGNNTGFELRDRDSGKMIHFSQTQSFLPSRKIMIPKHNVRKEKEFLP